VADDIPTLPPDTPSSDMDGEEQPEAAGSGLEPASEEPKTSALLADASRGVLETLVTVRHSALLVRSVARSRILDLRRGELVAVRTAEGTEAAVVLDESAKHVDHRGTEVRLVRRLNERDERLLDEQDGALREQVYVFARDKAQEFKLPVKVLGAELLLGGETTRVYYLARESFDLGPWVRSLAGKFRRHFTLRRLSPCEAARLSGDAGPCGRDLCCVRFAREFKPAPMRMARLQKITLDPASLGGWCGPIRCCIRYEFEEYQDADKALPRNGCEVCGKDGQCGIVRRRHLIRRTVDVLTDENTLVEIPATEIVSVLSAAETQKKWRERDVARQQAGPPADGREPRHYRRAESGRQPPVRPTPEPGGAFGPLSAGTSNGIEANTSIRQEPEGKSADFLDNPRPSVINKPAENWSASARTPGPIPPAIKQPVEADERGDSDVDGIDDDETEPGGGPSTGQAEPGLRAPGAQSQAPGGRGGPIAPGAPNSGGADGEHRGRRRRRRRRRRHSGGGQGGPQGSGQGPANSGQ
jgi:cell fate regulator YaaT (PSP1 superfamily)